MHILCMHGMTEGPYWPMKCNWGEYTIYIVQRLRWHAIAIVLWWHTMHVVWANIFMASADAPLWRSLVSKPRWWYQKNHPHIIGGSLVDGMTPLSCLYHDYLHRYGRREVDVMVALILHSNSWWIWWREVWRRRYAVLRMKILNIPEHVFNCTVLKK